MPSRREIEKIAETFRDKYWPSGAIPVDIDLIIEQELGIDIIPSPGLRREMNSDACMAVDRSTIYVDEEHFMNPKMSGRVRFSLAHELGHYVLHESTFKEYQAQQSRSIVDWAHEVKSRIETSWMETEANEFAGCFLVPREALQQRFNETYVDAEVELQRSNYNIAEMNPSRLYPYLANKICLEFEVSSAMLIVRLERIRALENRRS